METKDYFCQIHKKTHECFGLLPLYKSLSEASKRSISHLTTASWKTLRCHKGEYNIRYCLGYTSRKNLLESQSGIIVLGFSSCDVIFLVTPQLLRKKEGIRSQELDDKKAALQHKYTEIVRQICAKQYPKW